MKTFYAWGANSHAQLGIGYHSEMCICPQKVDFDDELIVNGNISIKSISGGGGHVFILDQNGRLFGCGWNNRGQLGIGTTNDEHRLRSIPLIHFDNKTIDSISCGWDCSAAICSEDGSVYLWGSNSHNQLGVPQKKCAFSATPIRLKMPQNEKVHCVSFNLQSTCILTTTGIIYLFGKLKQYKEMYKNQNIIQHNGMDYLMVNVVGDIESFSAGQNHILLYDKFLNKIFGFGNNKYMQCETVNIKAEIVKYICSGWTHNGAVTEHGNVYLWGRNNYGQCGISLDHESKIITSLPTKLEIVEWIENVYLGAEHGVALTKSGKLFTWGWNEHGNCGNSSIENVFKPIAVNLPGKCLVAGSGFGFCYAFVDESYENTQT